MTIPCSRFSSSSSARALAFTLTELVVIIAVLVILVALQLPAWGKAGGRTRIVECSSHVRQLVLASHIYGNEYNDKLPQLGGGMWEWDMGGTAINVYTQYISWETFYCPDTGFDYGGNWALWNYFGAHVAGYAVTFPGAPTLNDTNVNATITPQPIPNSFSPVILPPPYPAQRVLFADATISKASQGNNSLKYTYSYTGIQGAYTHRTSHMNAALPAGGNLGMLDGHVEWRSFDDMRPRCELGSFPPMFWW